MGNRIDFNKINLAGVDGGEFGGLYHSYVETSFSMPLIRYTRKPRINEILKEKVKGKKQPTLIKSGVNKGKIKAKKIIDKTDDYYIDIKSVQDILSVNATKNVDIVILEKAGHSHSALSLRKQSENIEAIRIATRLLNIDLVEVSAVRWKEWFSLDDDKQKCIDYANSRQSQMYFILSQDGEAESYLIYLWFKEFYESLNIGYKYNYTAKTTKFRGKTKSKIIKVELLNINYLTATVRNASGFEFDIRVEDLNAIRTKD